jgi:hypothetical protein
MLTTEILVFRTNVVQLGGTLVRRESRRWSVLVVVLAGLMSLAAGCATGAGQGSSPTEAEGSSPTACPQALPDLAAIGAPADPVQPFVPAAPNEALLCSYLTNGGSSSLVAVHALQDNGDAVATFLNGLPTALKPGEACPAMAPIVGHEIVLGYPDRAAIVVYDNGCALEHNGQYRYGSLNPISNLWGVDLGAEARAVIGGSVGPLPSVTGS